MERSNLASAVRENWKTWAPQWTVVAVFVFVGATKSTFGWEPDAWLVQSLMLLFLVTGWFASRPYMKRRVGFWPLFFWTMLLPFIAGAMFAIVWHGVIGELRV